MTRRDGMDGADFGARHAPLNNALADALREAILAGRFRPGERLVEERLAAEFGVSRIPIREALRVLSAAGLVTIEPRKGASVTSIDAETAAEMVEVRATLEALNARLAARHSAGNGALIGLIRSVLDQGNAAARSGDAAALIRLNAEYHELLAEAGANRILGDMMRALRERTAIFFGSPQVHADRSWAEHAEILNAIIDGNEAQAAMLAARHVAGAGRPIDAGAVEPPRAAA